jgi:hypothetical protein
LKVRVLRKGARFLGVFAFLIKRFQLAGQILDIDVRLPFTHAHAIANKELEEIVEELHHLAGKALKLFFGDIGFMAVGIPQLALNEVVNEFRAVHLAAVFIDLLDDVFLDHHDQIVFV